MSLHLERSHTTSETVTVRLTSQVSVQASRAGGSWYAYVYDDAHPGRLVASSYGHADDLTAIAAVLHQAGKLADELHAAIEAWRAKGGGL
jgi:hypothetical protein